MTGRALRLLVLPLLACVSGLALSACGSQANALGHEACLHVAKSLSLYASAGKAPASSRQGLLNEANEQLRVALPQAALAASSDTDWQALEATLSESSRVSEQELVQALSAQCAQTLS